MIHVKGSSCRLILDNLWLPFHINRIEWPIFRDELDAIPDLIIGELKSQCWGAKYIQANRDEVLYEWYLHYLKPSVAGGELSS